MAPQGAGPADRPRRSRELWVALVGRPLLLVFWVLVLWGTLGALSLAVSVFELGPREALVRLFPRPATAGDYLNAASVVLALMTWVLVGVALGRTGRTPS